MSHLENVKQYILPADLLLSMLRVYRFLGKNEQYCSILCNNLELIKEKTLETDTYFLAQLIGLNINDNRMRLIVTKNSEPRTADEKVVAKIKTVLTSIRTQAQEYPFNSSDLLSMVNKIFGRNYASFDMENLVPVDSKGKKINFTKKGKTRIPLKSRRVLFDTVLDDYYLMIEKKQFEPIFLSSIVFVEMANIKPFTKGNELMRFLALYYMILRSGIHCFYYLSFFEIFFKYQMDIQNEVNVASLNYYEGFMQVFGLNRILFKIIEESYINLENFLINYQYDENLLKVDHVEQTIEKLPDIFTKADIKNYHPNISDSTINRVLKKLKCDNRIRPLGTGRSARWVKIETEEKDISRLLR
ncbi:MAG: hypothetical protein PHG08_05530 [Bacilli bacterium]|nr:hypothetical protein [Bacilli bacterium]